MKALKFIDLFAGAGGFSCGLEMAGLECVLGIDRAEVAMKTFAKNHKKAKTLVGDISKISSDQILDRIENHNVDLICGGPPCQGFSTVGLGDADDERNHLFLDFIRVVKLLRPSFIVIENVTGLMAKKNENTLLSIFKVLEDEGYCVDVEVLSAHHYGVPQKRRRTFIIGNRYNIKNIYPTETNLQNPNTVQWAFENLISQDGVCLDHNLNKSKVKNDLDRQRLIHIPEGKGIRYERDQEKYLPQKLWYDIDWSQVKERRFRETRLQRLSLNSPSPTINTSRFTYYHPNEIRHLTVREASAIQSFPPFFSFCGTETQKWRQIGNAVPPLLAKAIGKSIIYMEENKNTIAPYKKDKSSILNTRKKAFTYKTSPE